MKSFRYPKKYGKLPGQKWLDIPFWDRPYWKLGNKMWEWPDGCTFKYVYVLYAPDVNRVKIGMSKRPIKRMDDIELSCPIDLEPILIVGVYHKMASNIECMLHKAWRRYNWRGEWFEYEGKLKDYIECIISDIRSTYN